MATLNQRIQAQLTRRQFLKSAGILAISSLVLSAACKRQVTTTITSTVPPTTTTPATTVRLLPVNGLEYLVNSDPATIDDSTLPVTPPDLLHVLNPSPAVDIDAYRLTIHGLVNTPLNLTYADLTQFSMVNRTELLICPTVFADNPDLEGFTIQSLLIAAGVQSTASQLTLHSLDNLQENAVISDLTTENAFMALKTDGQVLTSQHGYPVRLVRPGQFGVFWFKCISDIEVL
jgi:DMSO/TMAO reductase YedYZ molybdopterin-dependent catalytic subunit